METDVKSQPLPARKDISVVVCAYTDDRWHALVEAIESIRNQTVQPREVIVVVDHNPALLEKVQKNLPGVAGIENHQPRGLAGARNSGVEASSGKVIAFMDEDAVAEPDWLERLDEGYTNPQVIGVGGAIVPLWTGAPPGWLPPEFHWVVGCTYRGMPDGTAPIRNLIGANMSFRREVFDRTGGFRIGMGRIGTRPLGCEETEFCIRALHRSPQSLLLYEPRARVRHRVPRDRARWRYFTARCFAEGLSKAQVAQVVGAQDGLASERAYTFRTLPRGILGGIKTGFVWRDPSGFARAAAILIGLMCTTAGYLRGSIQGTNPQASGEVELLRSSGKNVATGQIPPVRKGPGNG